MFTSLVLAAALLPAAPVPKPTPPNGPAPYLLAVASGKDGKPTVAVMRTEKEKITKRVFTEGANGAQVVADVTAEQDVTRIVRVDLADVKGLTVTTAGGTAVDVKAAAKRLADGGTVVVSADGKPVDPAFLALLRDDTLVLASPELMPAKSLVVPAMPQPIPPPIAVTPGNDPPPIYFPGSDPLFPTNPGSEKRK